MATAATHRELSSRLEIEVERHGCGQASCDVCRDLEACLAPPALPVARRLPELAADMPEHAETLLAVFGGQLEVY